MKTVLIIGLCLAAAGCARSDPGPTDQVRGVAADNSEMNERDRAASAVTPIDQGNNAVDLGITQNIRQGVVKDESLSMSAKNVKIITADGIVTLRGPVKNDVERTTIANIAAGMLGVKRVDNQLELGAN